MPDPPNSDDSALPKAFFVMLAMWVVLPLAMWGTYAQDATAFLTAGALYREAPEAVYASNEPSGAQADRYYEEVCARVDEVTCIGTGAGYFSPPTALPLLAPIAALPHDAGSLLHRLLGAVAAAATMILLRRRIGTDNDAMLLATAMAMTPLVVHTVSLGQNTPLLALCAALRISSTPRAHALARGLLVAALVTLKLFPAFLFLALAMWRRWRELAVALVTTGGLSLIATLRAPALWGDFLDALARADLDLVWSYQVSLASTLVLTFPALDSWHGHIPLLVAAVLAAVWYLWARRLPRDILWAWILASLILVTTSAWPHYFIAPIPFLVLATYQRRGLGAYLPTVYAAGTIPLVLTWGTTSPLVILAPLGTLLLVAVVPALALSDLDRGARREA